MPGFISIKNYPADNGEKLGIIRFHSRAVSRSMDAGELPTQRPRRVADKIYERVSFQTAESYGECTWDNGKRTDGDLTRLFIERSSGVSESV